MFSALRQGALLYILEKGDKPVLKIGQVEGTTQPRFNPAAGFGVTVIDIAAKVDNERKDYIGVPSNASVHGAGNVVISESREAMISEVNSMLQTSKQIIDNVEYHRNVITACEDILKQLNPDYAKQQERDDAIDNLKNEVVSLKSDMSRILDLLTRQKAA